MIKTKLTLKNFELCKNTFTEFNPEISKTIEVFLDELKEKNIEPIVVEYPSFFIVNGKIVESKIDIETTNDCIKVTSEKDSIQCLTNTYQTTKEYVETLTPNKPLYIFMIEDRKIDIKIRATQN